MPGLPNIIKKIVVHGFVPAARGGLAPSEKIFCGPQDNNKFGLNVSHGLFLKTLFILIHKVKTSLRLVNQIISILLHKFIIKILLGL